MIHHIENERIKGWYEIAKAWGFQYPEKSKNSAIKQSKRFFQKIEIRIFEDEDTGEIIYLKPFQKDGRYVYTDQDVLCTLKANYVFGRADIAHCLGKSVSQYLRYLKKYKSLRKIIINPCGKFVYANKRDLDNFKNKPKYNRLKKTDKLDAYLKEMARIRKENEKKYENETLQDCFNCPVCEKPIK